MSNSEGAAGTPAGEVDRKASEGTPTVDGAHTTGKATRSIFERTDSCAPQEQDSTQVAQSFCEPVTANEPIPLQTSIPTVVPEVLPTEDEQHRSRKIKGAAQMAAGGVLTAAGVPMLILPGPGAAAIVGGAALISKGNRNFTGRAATQAEESLDAAAAKAAGVTKEAARKTGAKAASAVSSKIPVDVKQAARDAAGTVAPVAKQAAQSTASLAKKVVAEAPAIANAAGAAAKTAAKAAKPIATGTAKAAAKGVREAASIGKKLIREIG